MKTKIKFSQNLLDIFNYIESKSQYVCYRELLHYCLDYESYNELYLHHNQIITLLNEHNSYYVKPKNYEDTLLGENIIDSD